MNQDVQDLASGLVDASYIQQGAQALRRREKLLRTLLANRRIPEEAWDERHIHSLLHTLSGMDSNNFVGNLGAGEREARILSPMVRGRVFRPLLRRSLPPCGRSRAGTSLSGTELAVLATSRPSRSAAAA